MTKMDLRDLLASTDRIQKLENLLNSIDKVQNMLDSSNHTKIGGKKWT